MALSRLADRHELPAIYTQREYVKLGGLSSYSADFADVYRQARLYPARILKGAAPSDLPVQHGIAGWQWRPPLSRPK